MIRRRDHAWLPFWRHRTGGWVVSVVYQTTDGRAVGVTRPARFRVVALWRGLRADVIPVVLG